MKQENWERMKSFLNESTFIDLLTHHKSFICEDNGLVIGMAYVVSRGNPTVMFESDWAYVRMVAVHPNFQGRGIARKLMQQCIDYAKSKNEKILALHTSELMNTARHIYESMGFKVLKEIEHLEGVRYWVYTMALNNRID